MNAQHAMLRRAGVAAAAGLLAILAVPVGATGAPTPNHETSTINGVLADATWFGDEAQEPAVGVPRVLAVMGADATMTHRVPGQKPERTSQPAVVAMALLMPGIQAGDEPYQAELWCASDDFTFTVAADLSSAFLDVPPCEAMVVVYDEQTGEEAPNGVTVTLSASATWTATGPLESVKSHSRYLYDGSWTMDLTRASTRPATADITVIGLPGGPLVVTSQEGAIQNVKAGSMMHQ